MTLLTTELHNHTDPSKAFIVFAADRRISVGSSPADEQEKIFSVPSLNAGIGYFGLAEIPQGNGRRPMADWVKEVLAGISGQETLQEFAQNLAASLNGLVPKLWQSSVVSGFHISGFSKAGSPEFWYVRNVDDDRSTLFGEYRVREDFQNRDAPKLKPGEHQIYRNGDIRAHVLAWESIDDSFGTLLSAPDFKQFTTPTDYVEWVKFKIELIAEFYDRFCRSSIIGKPVDGFLIIPKQS